MRTIVTAIAFTAALVTSTVPVMAQQDQRQPRRDGQQDSRQPQQQQQQSRPDRQPQYNRPQPNAGGMRMNEMLADRVYTRLAERLPANADIRVQTDEGVVTLGGTVPSEDAKRRAMRIARRTDGVMEVRDQLRIEASRATTTANVSDAELSKRVAQKIAADIPGAKAGEDWWLTGWRVEGPDNRWNLVVEADNGTVWLEGDVPRSSIIRKALEAARQVEGVRTVRNQMDLNIHDAYGPYGPGYYRDPYGAYYSPFGYPYAYGYGPAHYGWWDADRRADRLGADGAASPDTSGTREDTSSKGAKQDRR